MRGTPHSVIMSKSGGRTDISGAYPYEEKKPGLYYRLGADDRKKICSEETKLCGIKAAIENLLNE